MVEQSAVNRWVVGSSPTSGANFNRLCDEGFLEEERPLSVKWRPKMQLATIGRNFTETRPPGSISAHPARPAGLNDSAGFSRLGLRCRPKPGRQRHIASGLRNPLALASTLTRSFRFFGKESVRRTQLATWLRNAGRASEYVLANDHQKFASFQRIDLHHSWKTRKGTLAQGNGGSNGFRAEVYPNDPLLLDPSALLRRITKRFPKPDTICWARDRATSCDNSVSQTYLKRDVLVAE
jgi:hypothetical protein